MLSTRPRAAIGRVMRGSNGGWMGGFQMVTRLFDIFQVEARALLKDLKLALSKGYHQVEIESDNATLISIIQNGLAVRSMYSEVRLIHD